MMSLSQQHAIFFWSLNASNPTWSKIEILFAKYGQSKHFKEGDDLFKDGMGFLFTAYARNQDVDVLHFSKLYVVTGPYDLQHEEENNQNYLRSDLLQVPNF